MRRWKRGIAALGMAVVLLCIAACGGRSDNGNIPTAQGGASITPSAAPVAIKAPATETLPVPVDPPAASAAPTANPQRTGKVTAVRLADPSYGWTGGEGWLARTTDGGKHWTVQLRHQYVVVQIFALDRNRAWATLDIGDKRGLKLMSTTDGGKHWKDAGVTPNYDFLHFVSDKEAFSGNARTTDGGKTWTALPIPGKIVGDAYFHDRLHGWVVTNGPHGFSIRRTTDGGKTWPTVLSRETDTLPTFAVIRSAGKNDAWVELVGGSGMSQTSYSLFHTSDGGKTWLPVLANSGAGSGPAPGFSMEEKKVPRNSGASPGALYVVNTKTAFLGGKCQACDNPNTLGKTTDGGKTWVNLKPQYPGYGEQQVAAADAGHIWWINTDEREPSRMYVSSDGGAHWALAHTFDKPAYAAK